MAARASAELAPEGLAAVLVVLTAEIVGTLAPADSNGALDWVANRSDGHARRSRRHDAAMLWVIGA